jgi:uncharacterized coiled-coil protein SlyX
MNLDDHFIPSQLIEIYQKIPDYDVVQYVFMIGKGKSVSSESMNFSSQFPKNYLLPKLQEFFEKFTEFEKSISKKDKVIEGLEDSVKDLGGNAASALQKKDKVIEGLEDSVKEQKDYIKNLEKHIHSLESQLKKFKFWKK